MREFESQLATPEAARLRLMSVAEDVGHSVVQKIAYVPLLDPHFWVAPASKSKHHAYVGGLAVHTAQVANVAMSMALNLKEAKMDHLFCACVWHDYGKVLDYRRVEEEGKPARWDYTEHSTMIGHLPRSFADFMAAAKEFGLEPWDTEFIGHLILAHHGRYEWGSPKLPATSEAWCIHAADMLSAQYSSEAKVPGHLR